MVAYFEYVTRLKHLTTKRTKKTKFRRYTARTVCRLDDVSRTVADFHVNLFAKFASLIVVSSS
jgi:hypothetical protein